MTARRCLAVLGVAAACTAGVACRKSHAPAEGGRAATPDEGPSGNGMLHRIAARLEEAYGKGPLPPAREPDKLADRLAKWKGFRDCAPRTFAARRAGAARGAPVPQGSVGWAAVEECAVQGAVADKDASLCDRLAEEFPGAAGQPGLAALRCHDTRARVLGLPEECPVVDLPGGRRGRNPECLAAARRDASLCPLADDPIRCRAILAGDPTACTGGAPNCRAAATYWSELVPAGEGRPLVSAPGKASFDLDRKRGLRFRFTAPAWASAVSWPAGAAAGPVALGWGGGLDLSFAPEGAVTGTVRPRVSVVTKEERGTEVSCAPDARSTLELRFHVGDARPGATLQGTVIARSLPCSDGDLADLTGRFNLPILDLRASE